MLFNQMPSPIPLLYTHLKRASESKRKGSFQVPLLWAPALTQFVVPDQHLLAPFTEARVDVKGDIVAPQKVHSEPVDNQRLSMTLQLVFYQLVYLVQKLCIEEKDTSTNSLHFSIWFDMAQYGHHHLVKDSSGQVQVIWNTLNSSIERIILMQHQL